MAKTGDWVQIHSIVMEPSERSTNLPDVTKAMPLELRQKGFLKQEAEIGDEVEVETVIGRVVRGKLVSVDPVYEHGFGKPVPELLTIGMELKRLLEEGDELEA